jgi:2-keto-4-pentenoate hydratase/2-oxohepta-3-ene-1,7-dioic acid hydratase in catechol pathway
MDYFLKALSIRIRLPPRGGYRLTWWGGEREGREPVRLATVKSGDRENAALVLPGGVVPVAEIRDLAGLPTDLFSLLEGGGFYDLGSWWDGLSGAALDELLGRAFPASGVEHGPLYRRPRKIWGIGLNYAEHAEDLDEISPSDEPASFMRPDTTIIGPGEEIRLPEQSKRVTAEAELAVIIGREAKNVSEEDAPSVVAGFTTILDMTAEDILRRNPRYLTRAKSFDTFFSFGPQLVTPDEVEDIGELEVATVLNGEVRRKNVVSNMIFPPWFLVSFHSKVMTLLPGDIICTGTPGAVEVRDGDVAECRISSFESLSNPVRR